MSREAVGKPNRLSCCLNVCMGTTICLKACWQLKTAYPYTGKGYMLSKLNLKVTMEKVVTTVLLLVVTVSAAALLTGFTGQDKEPVRHIVVFKYKDGATDYQIQQVTAAFRNLKDEIPGILSFEHGINNSPEGKDQGFTHVYQVTFESAEARDNYLPHPNHKKFGELLGRLDILEDVFVVDYVPQD